MAEKAPRQCRKTARHTTPDARDVDKVPLCTSLISATFRRELQRVWQTARQGSPTTDSTSAEESISIPSFKVGTLEMYRRFPKQYDLLMRRHNCGAIETYLHSLLDEIQQRMERPCSETIRVADFGCGTGRVTAMLARHKAVSSVYGYDHAPPMLRECFVHITRAVAAGRPEVSGMYAQPDASGSDDDGRAIFIGDGHATRETETAVPNAEGTGSVQRSVLRVCVRPACFTAVRNGFLDTPCHPRCGLVVVAWALSYVMRAQWGGDRWHDAVDETLQRLMDLLEAPGVLVVIETLGTDTTEPTRRNTLATRLEEHWKFERQWVRTDYTFRNAKEAESLTRFFFGESVAQRLAAEGRTALPECTGVWTLWRT